MILSSLTLLFPQFNFKTSVIILLLCCSFLADQVECGKEAQLPHCPHQCNCDSLRVNCGDQSLIRIPDLTIVRHHPVILNFSYNQIEEIRTSNFMSPHLNHIQIVHLDYNSIYFMEDTPFASMPNLTHLDLSKNLLESVSPHLVESNFKLETLNLTGNVFGMHPPTLISTSLVKLDLSYCKIQRFAEEHLKYLPNLKHLDLSVNMITHVHSNVFTIVPLKSLNIAYNSWKCNCNTIRLHHHLLKLQLISKQNIQCLHSNNIYENVYNLDQPIHQHKFCIKESNQGNHKAPNTSRTHNLYNYTRSKYTKTSVDEDIGNENAALTIIMYAVGLFLLVVIVTTTTAVLVRRFYVGNRRTRNNSSTYNFMRRNTEII